MYILRSMFVISGSSLYPGFIIVRLDCMYLFIGGWEIARIPIPDTNTVYALIFAWFSICGIHR